MEAAHTRDRRKNELLPKLQQRFEQALLDGRILRFSDVVEEAEGWLGSLGKELNA